MTDWKQYEEYEEELHDEISKKSVSKIKIKKTWKQITEVKNDREHTKKQWQKKRRKSKGESNNK
jgi:hypothetical protein